MVGNIQAIEKSVMTADEKMLEQMAGNIAFEIYQQLSPEARSRLAKVYGKEMPAASPYTGVLPMKKPPLIGETTSLKEKDEMLYYPKIERLKQPNEPKEVSEFLDHVTKRWKEIINLFFEIVEKEENTKAEKGFLHEMYDFMCLSEHGMPRPHLIVYGNRRLKDDLGFTVNANAIYACIEGRLYPAEGFKDMFFIFIPTGCKYRPVNIGKRVYISIKTLLGPHIDYNTGFMVPDTGGWQYVELRGKGGIHGACSGL